MKPLRILLTMPYLPWPITSGGKARQYHLLRAMAQRGHDITLLVQAKTEADADVKAALAPWVKELIVLPRRALKDPRTLWRAAFSPLPLLTTVNGHAPALTRQFEQLLQRQHWDIVQIEHSYGYQPFEAVLSRHRQPFVLVEHNVESELGAATYGKWPAWAKPFARYDQWRGRRWERHVLGQASLVVAVTESDARKLGAWTRRPPHVVTNGADIQGFASVKPDLASKRVLFVGNYEYAPNVDAIEWAMEAIWPRLWALQPDARFVVCGHALPPAWRQRWADPRIEWRGYVDHLPSVQSQSAVFLAALRFGGGSKLKVLEALAAGLPVVSTTEGLSGLGVKAGEQAMVADNAEAIAQAVSHLLDHPEQAVQMGLRARAHVTARFDWQACATQLEAAYAALLADDRREPACA
ncbi:glycosyltransferase family 4 protein [Aquabacterium sp. NJ1]|uniref:glycosyltransferase family 4 protein n=1 Tax=Aquabacterium sp. NJ1 TaxID=1538295 RepID=UPI00190F3391|nr:glycosyltransferase family 4 protein [Aquabacterium sp. NJ1]